jgi:hypothetical protein
MIVETRIGKDVLMAPEKHLVVAANGDGYAYDGMGVLARLADGPWPELMHRTPEQLGKFLSKEASQKTLHAIIVHNMKEGWLKAPGLIEESLNQLPVPDGEFVACALMGDDLTGIFAGANLEENRQALERSNKQVVVYQRLES